MRDEPDSPSLTGQERRTWGEIWNLVSGQGTTNLPALFQLLDRVTQRALTHPLNVAISANVQERAYRMVELLDRVETTHAEYRRALTEFQAFLKEVQPAPATPES